MVTSWIEPRMVSYGNECKFVFFETLRIFVQAASLSPLLLFSSLSRRTQRSIEASNAVHVLPVLGLLLFPDSVDVIAGHFRVLCTLER